jgi:hypothetical protein
MPAWLPQLLYYAPRRGSPYIPDDGGDSDSDGDDAVLEFTDGEAVEFGDGELAAYSFEE